MPFCIAISGFKNSGKTTLIENLIPILSKNNLKVAVIKHDGHDYMPDVPGTDSYRHFNSGAYATAVFSNSKFSITKRTNMPDLRMLLDFFSDADIILCEGLKNEPIHKLFILSENDPIPKDEHIIAWIIDENTFLHKSLNKNQFNNKPVFSRNNYEKISEYILNYCSL